ncbi:hypothetical protein SK128_005032 [Halocaridina rubra]|uniref:Integrin alpha-2 domain-containing protein n=1 Tax=Halocaridina rubra TaxID=373956 RepID=A0AAN8XL09_HALRR
MTQLDLRPLQFRVLSWRLIRTVIGFLTTSIPASGFNLEPQSAIIFSDPTPFLGLWGRPSYFGYSVALQVNPFDNSSWLIVGSPRANSTFHPISQIREPGAIYKCDLSGRSQVPCIELGIDRQGNVPTQNPNYEFSYYDFKNGGWLGASLDSQLSFQDGRQATGVCAPRWINQQYYDQGFLNMNGACYWLNVSLPNAPAEKKLPLIQYSKQTQRLVGINLYYHAHGQAGMSLHFPDDPTEMIVGAPGVFNWQGSVVRFKDFDQSGPGSISSRRRRSHRVRRQILPNFQFATSLVPNPYYTSAIRDFDLNGYSVTSGRYFSDNKLLYASGAPKGADSYGKVIIFSFPDREAESLRVREERQGMQLGENFGASLLSTDVNGDDLSDLIVGCPTYSGTNKADMGRIQVFQSSQTGLATRSDSYYGSSSSSARFGTALASPGDMNHDGFQDIAVGSPFEDEGKGAVYIYMGSPSGLRGKFAQRLSAEDFPSIPNLVGLGMSISKGIDVDGNHYKDLAIGSFMSGHALVLRSRAVASLQGELSSNPPALLLEDTRLTLKACIAYTGDRVPGEINLQGNITLDYSHPSPRATFRDSGSFIKAFEIIGRKGRKHCAPYDVDVKGNKIDPRRPILVQMEYAIHENPSQLLLQPKTDPEEDTSTTLPIGIVTECEDDGDKTCQIDMTIDAAFQMNKDQDKLVIGQDNRLVLEIAVHNLGESVFLPNVTVTVPAPFALFLPTTHNCDFTSRDSRTTLVCQLANPIKRGHKDSVNVTVDASYLSDSTDELKVDITGAGEGVELHPNDNSLSQSLKLQANAELTLHGYSKEEQIIYQRIDEDKINTTLPTTSFTHFYTLVKSGPTAIGRVELTIDIPINFTTEQQFVTVYAPQTNFLGQPFICSVEGTTLAIENKDNGNSDNNITTLVSEGNGAPPANREEEILLIPKRVRSDISSDDPSLHAMQEFNCRSLLVRCAQLRCTINSWPSGSKSAELAIRMDVNFTLMAHHMSAHVGAFINSTATASIKSLNPGLDFVGKNVDTLSIKTQFLPSSLSARSVSWWIILLAVLGGLLLLILLAYLLYRIGFFRRKKLEEMETHRAHVASNNSYGATAGDN